MNKLRFHEKIYTYHIDFVGHVNNIIYIQWMENGRVKLLEAIGMPAHEIAHTEEIFPILTETNIQYKKPLFLNNTVTIECWVSRLNNASAIMEFRFYNEKNELCATGWQKGLFIDRNTLRPARLIEEQRLAFKKYLIPDT
ncbi:MAG TPA: thioesterase family protein [Draconibacterium sp.]|nr:thioesterase family protein [Draconibacterium sp.]